MPFIIPDMRQMLYCIIQEITRKTDCTFLVQIHFFFLHSWLNLWVQNLWLWTVSCVLIHYEKDMQMLIEDIG